MRRRVRCQRSFAFEGTAIALLVTIPITAVLDTLRATSQGWVSETPAASRFVVAGSLLGIGALGATLSLPASRAWLRERALRLMLASFSSGLALLIGEAALKLFVPFAPFHLRRPGTSLELTPEPKLFPGVSARARITWTEQGTRGASLERDAPHKINVLCIGGSTTESLFLDDGATWPDRLQQKLDYQKPNCYAVGNAGHCDYGVAEHLKFVRESPLIDRTDVFVIASGASDLMRFLIGLDTGGHAPPIWYRSRLFCMAREVWNGPLGHGMLVDRTGAKYEHARGKIDLSRWNKEPDFDYGAACYGNELQALLRALGSKRKRVVCVTQPVLWDVNLQAEGMRRLVIARMFPHPLAGQRIGMEQLREGMDRYNDVLRIVCKQTNTAVVDAAEAMNGRVAYFYDDYHLTMAGSRQMAELVAKTFHDQNVAELVQQRTTAP